MKPEYHASPIDPPSSYVVAESGEGLCDLVHRSGGKTVTILSFYDLRPGLKGECHGVLDSREVPVMCSLPELQNQRTNFDRGEP
jgi:hypothetical protein